MQFSWDDKVGKKTQHYQEKFESYMGKTLYELLSGEDQNFLREIAFRHRLTFQEFKQIAEACRDLSMWGENSLAAWWQDAETGPEDLEPVPKTLLMTRLRKHLHRLKHEPKIYPVKAPEAITPKPPVLRLVKKANKTIFGKCPVASDRTLCCQLHTLDAVEMCPFGCSYCTIQTFYNPEISVNADFAEKLRALKLAPGRFYHIGTGQSSDSLALGNYNNILDDLRDFAARNPQILLELKTKSDQTAYFETGVFPENLVVSWSLNPPVIVEHEEHLTAGLPERLAAARRVADRGVGVAFHFHPMVYYQGWETDYKAVAEQVMSLFNPAEVMFITFGSVTLIKPVIQRIRHMGHRTRILQMEMVADPHGKMTYPDNIKTAMFRHLHSVFRPWHHRVYFYLCMETAAIWKEALGYVYTDNIAFEADFARQVMAKVRHRQKQCRDSPSPLFQPVEKE